MVEEKKKKSDDTRHQHYSSKLGLIPMTDSVVFTSQD